MNPSPHDQMIPNDFVTPYLLSHLSRGAELTIRPADRWYIPLFHRIHNYIIINCNDIRGQPSLLPFWLASRLRRFCGLVRVLIEVAYDRASS